MVRNHHQDWSIVCQGQHLEAGDQVFARAEIETGGRLVKQEQFRISHQCPSDQYALLLTLGKGAERPGGESRDAQLPHDLDGATDVFLVVLLVPAAGDTMSG